MKKLSALVLALLALFTYTAFADGVLIEKTVYEGKGKVEVDFLRDVRYENPGLIVQDSEGAAYAVTVLEADEDDLKFRVDNFVPGREYSFTLSGVRTAGSGSAVTVTGSFLIPENEALAIREVEFDFEDSELEVEFFERVNLQGADLRITDAEGREYAAKIRELDKDGFEAYVPGLEWGESYTIEVLGLGEDGTLSASFSFTAVDD